MKTLIGCVGLMAVVAALASCSVSYDGIKAAASDDGHDAGAGENVDVGLTRRDALTMDRQDTAGPGPDAAKPPGTIGESCATDDDCETRTCLSRVCSMKPNTPAGRADGAACDKANLCKSGFCVDGVCCESACDGACRTCVARQTAGSCVEIAEGQAPARRGMCEDQRASCGTTGLCAAGGICARAAPGDLCGAEAVCSSAGELTASRCDAAGLCALGKTSCNGFVCREGGCATICADDDGCVTGEICTMGVCGPPGALIVPHRRLAPKIDGASGLEDAWASVPPYELQNQILGMPVDFNPSDFDASFRVLWTDEAFYVWIGVFDLQKVRNSGDNPWHDDCAEVYFDLDRSRGAVYDGKDDFQYLLPYTPAGQTPTLFEPKRKRTSGVEFATTTDAFGYYLEARFPWATLGRTPAPGTRIGFDLHVDDDDGDTNGDYRNAKLGWHGTKDDAFQTPSAFGTAILSKD